MSNLKELIDHLYEEVVMLPAEVQKEDEAVTDDFDTDIDPERLRLAVRQMSECLQQEDLGDLQAAAILNLEDTTRLLMQWESICNGISGLNRHMKELDEDIARMQPWGDFDVVKLNQLQQHDCNVMFWKMPVSIMATMTTESWYNDYQATIISHDQSDAYFITISLMNETPEMPALAERLEICPCPVSTLIMLQTRDKDSLKRMQTKQGDFALAHYAELRETLRSVLPPGTVLPKQHVSHRQLLKARLHKLFKK